MEELEHPSKNPMCPEHYATYNSFLTAREEGGRRQFRSFLMDVVEARAMKLSRQMTLDKEHARPLFEA